MGGLYNWKPIFTFSCLAGFAGVSTGSAVAEELIQEATQHILPYSWLDLALQFLTDARQTLAPHFACEVDIPNSGRYIEQLTWH